MSQRKIEDLSDDNTDRGKDEKESKPKRTTSRPSASAKQEAELRDRLTGIFDRIAEALQNRGDEELSEIIHEDAEIMSSGLLLLTRSFKFLRSPLLLFLAVIEPLLSFGRVARVLVRRVIERRVRLQAERQEAEAYYPEDEQASATP